MLRLGARICVARVGDLGGIRTKMVTKPSSRRWDTASIGGGGGGVGSGSVSCWGGRMQHCRHTGLLHHEPPYDPHLAIHRGWRDYLSPSDRSKSEGADAELGTTMPGIALREQGCAVDAAMRESVIMQSNVLKKLYTPRFRKMPPSAFATHTHYHLTSKL